MDSVLKYIPAPMRKLPGDVLLRIQNEALGDGLEATKKMFGHLMAKVTEEDVMSLPQIDKDAAFVAYHVYDDPFDRPRTYHDYTLLEQYNSIEYCVYHNTTTHQLIIGYRGTEKTEMKDYISDVNIVLGTQAFNERFQNSIKIYDEIVKTYPKEIITITWHSMWGTICYMIAQAKNPDHTAVFNPGSSLNPTFLMMFKDTQFGAGRTKRVFTYRIIGDVVSSLSTIWYTRTFHKGSVNPVELHTISNFLFDDDKVIDAPKKSAL